ncbi:MAG: PHD/YefM family antitoxin component YafN of YafNO toxin-antitoxin module [Verrucomicrobiales bacterium]|jgi:PHD/YefM family antitoxin component YafN of YafNO toxin-antitoxin module
MSTAAAEILEQIHGLPTKEKWEVYNLITEEMDETDYLNSSEANARRMDEAQRDYEAKKFEEHDLIEP